MIVFYKWTNTNNYRGLLKRKKGGFEVENSSCFKWARQSPVTCVSGLRSAPPNIHRVDWEAGHTFCSWDGGVMSTHDYEQCSSCSVGTRGTLPLSLSSSPTAQWVSMGWTRNNKQNLFFSYSRSVSGSFFDYLKRLNVVSLLQPLSQVGGENLPCHVQCWTKRDSSFCQTCREVWVHAVTAVWEKCFTTSAMPKRAVLKWCQTAWRAFAQTVTPFPLTPTDGVSHARSVEGWVTPLQIPGCVLNLIWTSHAHSHRHTLTRIYTSTHTDDGNRINQAASVEKMTIIVS